MMQQIYDTYLRTRTVTTDSRKITPGCLFFALKGETFDGNQFALQALEQGAALAVVSDPGLKGVEGCLVVEDVLRTLQELARFHREQLHIPVVGITGTNGKTTTKELVREVLAKRYRVHATAGNYNNHLGVPLTLLSMPEDTEIAIIEMGANHPGEIDFLCRIAQPTCGLITSVGKAHLEGFGSFEGVVRTKTELYRYLADKHEATLFVNADNDTLMSEAEKLCTIAPEPDLMPGTGYMPHMMPDFGQLPTLSMTTYGSAQEADVKGSCAGSNPYMRFYFEDDDTVYTVQTQLLGSYNFDNAMAAVCVGRHFGVELFDIKEALEAYTPTNNRSQYKETGRNRLILDCYNANPSSMKVALDNFLAMPDPKKVAILGSMKELGEDSEREHQAIVERLKESGIEHILIGPEFNGISTDECLARLKEQPIDGALVLVKGSNSNKLWLLEDAL